MSRKTLVEDDATQYDDILRRLRRLEQRIARPTSSGGVVVLTWPGGSSVSNVIVVPHGLEATPISVVASSNETELNLAVITFDATNISISAQDVAGTAHGAGSFGLARWIAIL